MACSLVDFGQRSSKELSAALSVNQQYVEMLSPLTRCELEDLLDYAVYAKHAGDGRAFLIAMDQSSVYESANFDWFKARYPTFIYVDRIAIGDEWQRQGLGRSFYQDLEKFAREARAPFICAEVNVAPPNPASHAFHARMGFNAVGEAKVDAKTVRYYVKALE